MLHIFGNATAGRQPVWRDAPDYRGSITILWWCLTTLALAIWSTIHLNVPPRHENLERAKWDPRGWVTKQQWRKVGWLLTGLLAPELVRHAPEVLSKANTWSGGILCVASEKSCQAVHGIDAQPI